MNAHSGTFCVFRRADKPCSRRGLAPTRMSAWGGTQNVPMLCAGITLIELLVSLVIAALLFTGLNSVVTGLLGSRDYVTERTTLTRDAEFAMDRMVRMVSHSPHLLLPMPDNPGTNWPEDVREQTIPPSPPIGDSVNATAVLAVALPAFSDLDFDGFPDADDDRDGLVDEDPHGDLTFDTATGIILIDDDGDGYVDEDFSGYWDDDEQGGADEDPVNGIDDDNDGQIDEDPYRDINGDGQAGAAGVDEDGDGVIDEGDYRDEDEDGQTDEDSYNPVVFFLNGGELIERIPVPWDEDGGGIVNGRDFVLSPIAENVTRLRFERVPAAPGRAQLVDITLELATPAAGTVSLNTRVRVGGAL